MLTLYDVLDRSKPIFFVEQDMAQHREVRYPLLHNPIFYNSGERRTRRCIPVDDEAWSQHLSEEVHLHSQYVRFYDFFLLLVGVVSQISLLFLQLTRVCTGHYA